MSVRALSCAVAASCLWLAVGAGPGAAQEPCNVTGVWNSTFGRLELQQKGETLTGKFAKTEGFFERITGTIEGKINGATAEWTWSQSDNAQGHGRWEVSPSCRALDGKWGRTDKFEMGNWFATRAR